MIEGTFPCDFCVGRREGQVSCNSRYDCYAYEKWVEESSKRLEESYGIREKTITSWESLQKKAREYNRKSTIQLIAQETIYSYNTVEFIYEFLNQDEKLTRKVLEKCTTMGKNPKEYLIDLANLIIQKKEVNKK